MLVNIKCAPDDKGTVDLICYNHAILTGLRGGQTLNVRVAGGVSGAVAVGDLVVGFADRGGVARVIG